MRREGASNAGQCVCLKRAACFMCGKEKALAAAPVQPESTAAWPGLRQKKKKGERARLLTYRQFPRLSCLTSDSIEHMALQLLLFSL